MNKYKKLYEKYNTSNTYPNNLSNNVKYGLVTNNGYFEFYYTDEDSKITIVNILDEPNWFNNSIGAYEYGGKVSVDSEESYIEDFDIDIIFYKLPNTNRWVKYDTLNKNLEIEKIFKQMINNSSYENEIEKYFKR